MYYFEYPITDTTIYSGNVTSSINTGLDEILLNLLCGHIL